MNNNKFQNFKEKIINNKEKIIITILVIILLIIFSAMIWDLYGKNLINKSSSPQVSSNSSVTTQNTSPQPTIKNNSNKSTKTNTKNTKKTTGNQANIAYTTYSTCLENTKDEPAAKDCCDCLSGDASVHKACRDAAATYDFSKNTVFKTFTIPSTLGRSGDYSVCTASGNQEQCKQCCESTSTNLACGDFQYCRTACNGLAQ